MKEKEIRQIDWDMIVMSLLLVISLWVNTVTTPDELQIVDATNTDATTIVEVVETAEVEEVIIEETVDIFVPNYASDKGVIEETTEVIYIHCPNCLEQLKITETSVEKTNDDVVIEVEGQS